MRRAKNAFAAADADLNKTFLTLRKKLPTDEFTELRDQQRKWLEHRDYMAADEPRQNGFHGDDPKQSSHYWDAMAVLTRARAEFLGASFDRALPKGITGSYDDSYGGSLNLEERSDGVVFQIDVVRGPTLHTGGLAASPRLKTASPFTRSRWNPARIGSRAN